MPVKYRRFMLTLLISVAVISNIIAYSRKPDVHSAPTTKNSIRIHIGETLPATLTGMIEAHPSGPSQTFPVSLHLLKPLEDCLVDGNAKWDSNRLMVSVNDINCGNGIKPIRGFLVGENKIIGIDPKNGQPINVLFTRSLTISE